MSTWPRPLVIGIVRVTPEMSSPQRQEARMIIASRANETGYALLETFIVRGVPRIDEVTYQAIESLALRSDASAFFVWGAVDMPRVEDIAYRIRLTVVEMPTNVNQLTDGDPSSRP